LIYHDTMPQIIDTDAEGMVAISSLAILLTIVPNTFIRHHVDEVSYYLIDWRDQISLTLCWRSFWECGREHVASSFPNEGGQYFIYKCLQPIATHITQHARPKIVDDPLTLILMMG